MWSDGRWNVSVSVSAVFQLPRHLTGTPLHLRSAAAFASSAVSLDSGAEFLVGAASPPSSSVGSLQHPFLLDAFLVLTFGYLLTCWMAGDGEHWW